MIDKNKIIEAINALDSSRYKALLEYINSLSPLPNSSVKDTGALKDELIAIVNSINETDLALIEISIMADCN